MAEWGECFTYRELVYIGHSNAITLIPLTDSEAETRMDLSGVTRIDVCIDATAGSSDTLPNEISWSERLVDDVLTWVIDIQVGLIPGIVAGNAAMRVVVVDAENTEGLVITHDLALNIIAAC